MILTVIAPMGGGKTLFGTLYALEYSRLNPNNKIISNFALNLPNAHYSPFFFFPYSELGDCLIIADDFYALRNVEGFISIIVNMSRKLNIDAILTCQYYTMIPRSVRILSNAIVDVQYIKSEDLLNIALKKGTNIEFFRVEGAVKLAKGYYNTKEVVKFPIDSEILSELRNVSKTKKDFEINVSLFTKNKTERKRLMKDFENND